MLVKAVAAVGSFALAQAIAQTSGLAVEAATHTATEAALRSKDPCECLNWAELYLFNDPRFYQKNECGRGLELYFLTKNGFNPAYAATEPLTGLPHKVCWDFFANFNYNSCLNVDLLPFPPDMNSNKTWCYVSNKCEALNGGQMGTNKVGFQQAGWHNLKAASTASWKYCTPGQDLVLSNFTVPALMALGETLDISLSRLLRLSYPAVEITWATASFFYEQLQEAYDPTKPGEDMSAIAARVAPMTGWDDYTVKAEAVLREIAISGQPTILDSIGHGDDFHVVAGRGVYEVARIEDGDMAYLGGHFYKEFIVECILGCATLPRLDADVDLDTV